HLEHLQPLQVLLAVDATAGLGSADPLHQAHALVIAKRVAADARAPTGFAQTRGTRRYRLPALRAAEADQASGRSRQRMSLPTRRWSHSASRQRAAMSVSVGSFSSGRAASPSSSGAT